MKKRANLNLLLSNIIKMILLQGVNSQHEVSGHLLDKGRFSLVAFAFHLKQAQQETIEILSS